MFLNYFFGRQVLFIIAKTASSLFRCPWIPHRENGRWSIFAPRPWSRKSRFHDTLRVLFGVIFTFRLTYVIPSRNEVIRISMFLVLP